MTEETAVKSGKGENKNEEEKLLYRDDFTAPRGQLIFLMRTWFPVIYIPDRKKTVEIEQFQCRSDDILVTSFPKSGTTWVQEIIYQIISGDVFNGRISNEVLDEKFPFLEFFYPGLDEIAKKPSPRLIKTHLPYGCLPKDMRQGIGKVVYIARNAKDVCVSNFHFKKMLTHYSYDGEFTDFYKCFLTGKVSYGPWMEHVLEFWQHRNDENILFVTYEDLHAKREKIICQIAEFLGYSLTDEQSQIIAGATSFDSMKENPMTNYAWYNEKGIFGKMESRFMRNGKVGDWKNYFTKEMEEEIEEKCLAPLRSTNLVFNET